jgi:hypothetical protein
LKERVPDSRTRRERDQGEVLCLAFDPLPRKRGVPLVQGDKRKILILSVPKPTGWLLCIDSLPTSQLPPHSWQCLPVRGFPRSVKAGESSAEDKNLFFLDSNHGMLLACCYVSESSNFTKDLDGAFGLGELMEEFLIV